MYLTFTYVLLVVIKVLKLWPALSTEVSPVNVVMKSQKRETVDTSIIQVCPPPSYTHIM